MVERKNSLPARLALGFFVSHLMSILLYVPFVYLVLILIWPGLASRSSIIFFPGML